MGELKRGGYTIPKRFCKEYSEHIDFIEAAKFYSLSQAEGYDKIIFYTQVPSSYKMGVNPITLRDVNYLAYIRDEHNNSLLNSASNGFSYYREHPGIKHFVPIITEFDGMKADESETWNNIGFYERNCITKDSFDWFVDTIRNLTRDVNLWFMGNIPRIDFTKLSKHVKSVTHTYDNEEFFCYISHYVYPRSKLFNDPFPNSLLEAVQMGCNIISPIVDGRTHKDGVDDILECIPYSETLDWDWSWDRRDTILQAKHFKQFYKYLFENNFEYQFNRNECKFFPDWIERELL